MVIDNTVIGVVNSSPKGCSESMAVAIYARVSKYLGFIRSVLSGQLNDEITELDVPQSQLPSNTLESSEPYC